MTIKRDLIPRPGVNFLALKGRPVYKISLRVEPNRLTEFLDFDSEYFLPVDLVTREVLRFIHQTSDHFNLSYLYRYKNWDEFLNFDAIYSQAWMEHYGSRDQDAAQEDIEAKEIELNEMVEDSARHIVIEIDGNSWQSPAPEPMS